MPQQRSEEEMDAKTEAIDNTRRLYDDVREAIEPLLYDFLTHPIDGKFCSFLSYCLGPYYPTRSKQFVFTFSRFWLLLQLLTRVIQNTKLASSKLSEMLTYPTSSSLTTASFTRPPTSSPPAQPSVRPAPSLHRALVIEVQQHPPPPTRPRLYPRAI